MEAETLALAQEMDFSLWALFARATITVKLVMILLILASFWSWAIIVQKLIAYRSARAEAEEFDRSFWSGEPLDELFDQIGVDPAGRSERVFAAGMIEWRRSHRTDGALIAGAQSRIERSMDVAISKESEELQTGLPVPANCRTRRLKIRQPCRAPKSSVFRVPCRSAVMNPASRMASWVRRPGLPSGSSRWIIIWSPTAFPVNRSWPD